MRLLEVCTVLGLLNGALAAPASAAEQEFIRALLQNPQIIPSQIYRKIGLAYGMSIDPPIVSPAVVPPAVAPAVVPAHVPAAPPAVAPVAVPAHVPAAPLAVAPVVVPAHVPAAPPAVAPVVVPAHVPAVPAVVPAHVPAVPPAVAPAVIPAASPAAPAAAQATGATWMDTLTTGLTFLASLPALMMMSSSVNDVTAAPWATVPEVQKSKSDIWPEATRVKIRYGPFKLPRKSERNLNFMVFNTEGSASYLKYNVKKPCEDQCTVLGMVADLEYADGSSANVTNDALFHHTIVYNTGSNVVEATCGQRGLENIFMSGNERSMSNYTIQGSKIKSGYKFGPTDALAMITDLQNFADVDKYVWQTMTYDIIDGPAPDYLAGHVVWLTIGSFENPSGALCNYFKKGNSFGASNLTGWDLPNALKFSEHSRVWKSDRNGYMLSAGGHLHAGGVNMEIFHNKTVVCDSRATYETSPAPGGGHSHGKPGMGHAKRQVKAGNYSNTEIEYIENMSMCSFPDGIPISKGDTSHIQANYDLVTHKGVKNGQGELDQIMGMAGLLVSTSDK